MPTLLSRWTLLLAVLLACLASIARADDARERWYRVELAGKKAGYMHSSQATAKEGNITTATTMKLSIARGATELSIELTSTYVETAAGAPVRIVSETKMGATPMSQTVTFQGRKATVVTKGPGNPVTTEMDLGEGWLMPAAAERYTLEQRKAGKAEISVKTVDASMGVQVIEATRRGFTDEEINVGGKTRKVTRVRSVVSSVPGVETIELIDEDGIPLRTETQFGGLSMVMETTTREDALGKTAAPELMVSTFVRPDRAVPNPRNSRSGEYILVAKSGKLPEIPPTGSQTISSAKEGVRVKIDLDNLSPAPADAKDARFLESSVYVSTNDPRVKELAESAVKGAGVSQAAQAEAIRVAVYKHMKKKALGVGFASAAEVARSGEGDCTEHAVLLAAMLRARAIPSRVACGLVYADQFAGEQQIFGFHMWAQALVSPSEGAPPRWVDLDAALSPDTAFDATHIALAVSPLSDNDFQQSMGAIVGVLGNLRIEVVQSK